MKPVTPKLAHNSSCDYPLRFRHTTTHKAKVSVRLRKDAREKIIEDALAFRVTMDVTQILKLPNETLYPVCPRCKITMEREYMRFCDRCGQKLGWSKLKEAVIVYPGYHSVTN